MQDESIVVVRFMGVNPLTVLCCSCKEAWKDEALVLSKACPFVPLVLGGDKLNRIMSKYALSVS